MDTGSAHARYRELLYRHGHGYPFWVPEPDANLPAPQLSVGMDLGDVGILNDDGGFDYLWNIHLPVTDLRNRHAPPNSIPIEHDRILDVRRTNFFFPRNTAINSTFVKKRDISIEAELGPAIVGGIVGGGAGFEFTAEGNSGAVLTLPRGGVRFNSLKLDVYVQEAAKNGEYWYRHINKVLRRGIQNGALYLVTGTDKCSSWGVASFANPSGSHGVTFKFIASDVASSDVSVRTSWSANFGLEHRDNVVDRSELSQCVFARGFVISVRESLWAHLFGMQVRVTSLDDGLRGRPPFVGPKSPFSRGAGSNANIDVQRLPDNQPQKSVAALLGEELLNQNHDALIAIVHDDDWIGSMRSGDFLQARDAGGSFLEDLVHHAATHSRAVVIDGICTFATANLMAPFDGCDESAVPTSQAQANDPTESGETGGQEMQGKFETALQLTRRFFPHPSFIGPLADALMAYSEASQVKDLTSSLTVDLARKITSGGRDDVYRGEMTLDGKSTYIAVKMPRYARISEAMLRGLKNEIALWSNLDHRNVLPLLGIYLVDDDNHIPSTVSPWCDDGTIVEYLKSARNEDTKRSDGPIEDGSFALLCLEVELLSQVANGLEYLHGQNIIHGDIKGCNILVQDGIARLCDFSHSVFVDEEIGRTSPRFGIPQERLGTGAHRPREGDTSEFLGTPRWSAPELLGPRAHRAREADIWALGCVLLEVRTLAPPWYRHTDSAVPIVIHGVDWPYNYPDYLNTKLWNLATQCWSRDPKGRPTSQVISARLKDMISSLEVLKYTFVSSGDLPLTKRPSTSIATSLWLAVARMCREASSNLGQGLSGVETVINALESVGERYPYTLVRHSARAMARRDRALADQLMTKLSSVELRAPLQGHTDSLSSLAFLADGRRLVSTSSDNALRIWDIETGETVIGPLVGHTHDVPCVAVHGSCIASCSYDGTFRVWDADNGHLVLGPISAHNGEAVNWIAYSADGTRITTAGDNNRVAVWDANTGVHWSEMVGHTDAVMCVAFSENGTLLISGSRDNNVRVWVAASGECVGDPMTGHTDRVRNVCLSPDDKRIFSSSDDGTIRVWDAETRALVLEPLQMDHSVSCMALSRDGKHLVSGSKSGKIAMRDAETGAAIPTPFRDHKAMVSGIAFSPDGRTIASASRDGTIALWDATDDWKRWDIGDEDVDVDNA